MEVVELEGEMAVMVAVAVMVAAEVAVAAAESLARTAMWKASSNETSSRQRPGGSDDGRNGEMPSPRVP